YFALIGQMVAGPMSDKNTMIFKQIESGGDRNYAYLVACKNTREGALIDPSPEPVKVAEAVSEEEVRIRYIINTHSHLDHSGGNDYFKKINTSSNMTFINCTGKTEYKDHQQLDLGSLTLEIINTPGHTKDSICIKISEKLLTGDTLFVGKVGGTYDETEAMEEYESLKKIILLPPETEIWPGHNYGVKPHSTLGYELENNPFIKRLSDFREFLWLKQNWPEYKKEHNIK
ncbi:MAG: hydroxyacylglutathione hydrolase family protein, partial [Candidatus Humimicrobiaceae bacterium]